MSETLQQLIQRRLAEISEKRRREVSLRELWTALPMTSDGHRPISYEIPRRALRTGHANIKDDTADALALMLEVSTNEVLRAAGKRPRLGRFELPTRADRLQDHERRAVVALVDAILDAAEGAKPKGRPASPPRDDDVDIEALRERLRQEGYVLAAQTGEPEQSDHN